MQTPRTETREEEFDVTLPEDAAEKIATVGQAIEAIRKLVWGPDACNGRVEIGVCGQLSGGGRHGRMAGSGRRAWWF